MNVIAIIGSTIFANSNEDMENARVAITEILAEGEYQKVVSGGAVGIDTLAIDVAISLNVLCQEFLPKHKRWDLHGYKERNMQIGNACDSLISIKHDKSKTFGSGWTANYTEGLGKNVLRILYVRKQFTVVKNYD